MRFYKQKRFYIPLLVLLLLLIIATALLYKPLRLVYWVAMDYPKEEQTIRGYDTLIANPSTFFANYTEFQPKLKDFQELNKQIQTIKRDFIIMETIGLGEYYISAINHLSKKFIYLSRIKIFFFGYQDIQTLNQSQMQQYKEILNNTQELKETISKEQFQFAQAYEDFYQSASKITDNLVYTHQINNIRIIVNSNMIASITCSDKICPPYKYIETLLPRVQESYIILKELQPNADVLKYINQSSYEEFIMKVTRNIAYLQHYLSNCKGENDQ